MPLMLSAANKHVMLSVVMVKVLMLSDVASLVITPVEFFIVLASDVFRVTC
jgi:hypothetical protein